MQKLFISTNNMSYLLNFFPILLFVIIFVGSGLYFTLTGADNAFYQLSPVTAIIPGITLAWIIHKGSATQKMHDFLDGIRHRDIITMCIIFLLAGAFSEITKEIGSIDATINFALTFVPYKFLIIGLFFVTAFISTSVGTSMGAIAAIAPIALALSQQTQVSPALCAATVVGGAMFGDNLSIVSDTTIAAVMSQEADLKKKLILNAKIALIASLITIIMLSFSDSPHIVTTAKSYNIVLITPYLLLIILAIFGINVFTSLVISITYAGLLGFVSAENWNIIYFSKCLNKGFVSMNEIMILSLLVGGLSGLTGQEFAQKIIENLSAWVDKKNVGARSIQLLIAKIVSIFDILLANNTIAIIFAGQIARELAKKYKIPRHYSAAWLDIFSCVFQGLLPYGAQILLVSTIVKVSPLSVVPYVFYCYILGLVSIMHIIFIKIKRP